MIVSNAGWTRPGPFDKLDAIADEDWLRTYQSNVLSHLILAQTAEQQLKANRGHIVITASVAGSLPSGSSMAYSVSKAGTVHLGKCLAKAMGPDVQVNSKHTRKDSTVRL